MPNSIISTSLLQLIHEPVDRYLSQVLIHQLQQVPREQLHTMKLPSFLTECTPLSSPHDDGEEPICEPKSIPELKEYWKRVEEVMKITREGTRGRLPTVFMNPEDGEFIMSPIRLGSRGDSYFEYLLYVSFLFTWFTTSGANESIESNIFRPYV
jgi:hypothetical protein